MGLWQASKGHVRFDGRDITALPTPDIAQGGIAYVPENMGIFADLTVRENMLLAARSGALDAKRLQWIFGLFPALEKFWNQAAGVLSGGQKQMLAIARAIVQPREDRKSVVTGKSGCVRVDLGGRRTIKKKKTKL